MDLLSEGDRIELKPDQTVIIGYFSTIYGLGGALTITSGAFILGACTIFLVPETKGADLA